MFVELAKVVDGRRGFRRVEVVAEVWRLEEVFRLDL